MKIVIAIVGDCYVNSNASKSIQYNNFNDFFSKIADVGIPETPTPLELANVGNGDTPPPLESADVLNGWSLARFA